MSADNWTACPKCKQNAEKAERSLKAKVEAQYGKIPLERWLELKAESEKTNEKLGHTLREDYELGIDNATFTVSYAAHCEVCGFYFTYKEEKAVVTLGGRS